MFKQSSVIVKMAESLMAEKVRKNLYEKNPFNQVLNVITSIFSILGWINILHIEINITLI